MSKKLFNGSGRLSSESINFKEVNGRPLKSRKNDFLGREVDHEDNQRFWNKISKMELNVGGIELVEMTDRERTKKLLLKAIFKFLKKLSFYKKHPNSIMRKACSDYYIISMLISEEKRELLQAIRLCFQGEKRFILEELTYKLLAINLAKFK